MIIDEQLLALATQWDAAADQYERRNESINRSACHDGARQLNVGLAAASRSHAEQLRKLVAQTAPAAAFVPEAPTAATVFARQPAKAARHE